MRELRSARCARLLGDAERAICAPESKFPNWKNKNKKHPDARFFICRREERNVPLWSICADNRLRYRTPTGLTFLFLYRRVRVSIANSFCEGEYKCARAFFLIIFCSPSLPSPVSPSFLSLPILLDEDFGFILLGWTCTHDIFNTTN